MKVIWAVMATANPMGQQRYESEIQAAMRQLPAAEEYDFHSVRVASMRYKAPSVARHPAGLSQVAPRSAALFLGDLAYRTKGIVHRFDLRLPPYRGTEVITIHDLPPMRFDDEGTMPRHSRAAARRAAAVITPSNFAAEEVCTLLGVERSLVHVIPYGVTAEYATAPPVSDDALRRLGIGGPFVLHAAGATKRKNLDALAAAWRDLSYRHPNVTLVLAGPPDERRDRAFERTRGCLAVGRLEPSVVAGLMRRADAVVVPSSYEGFGLPALEGMTCGAPVVAATAGALPEVCADAAEMVAPTAEGLGAGLERVLSDEEWSAELRRRGPLRSQKFSWATAAEAHLDVYRAVAGSRRP